MNARRLEGKNNGVIFYNIKDIWKFWIDYGGGVRFGIRKQYIHKRKTA